MKNQKQLTEKEVRAIFKDEIKKLFSQFFVFNNRSDIEFLPTAQAYKKLGYPAASQLRKAITQGVLRIGTEVQDRRSKDSAIANYYFNIPACIKRLNTPPEKRAK